MRQVLFGLLCLIVGTGAQCVPKKQAAPQTINDAPPGSIVGQCARDGTFIIVDTCKNCRTACDFKMDGYSMACKQCGQVYSAVSCHNCGANTYISSGKFKIKERVQ